MAVFSRPPDSASVLAEQLAERLLEGVGEGTRLYQPEKLEIYTQDVEATIERLDQQIRRFDGEWLPCVMAGPQQTPIPIDLRATLLLPPSDWESFSLKSLELLATRMNLATEEWHPGILLDYLKSRLVEFLATRFSARQSDISSSPGIQVRVTTVSSNLRVHYSPAYSFDPTNIVNFPTTPVYGWIQPGRYVFGACSPGNLPQFDLAAEYEIPKDAMSIHLAL